MSFLHPEFLYYMLPPLFILFALLLTQKETQEHFFSSDVMDKLRVSANTLTIKARNALFLLMGFFMVLALAQPVIKDAKVTVKAKSADIMIALDISDSMLATDIYPNRLESAKQKAITLLDDAPNERVGVVAFAKNSYLVSPLSFDSAAVSFLLRQLDTHSITEKGTDILSVLEVVKESQEDKEKKYLLLLTDGGDKDDFSDEIEMAKENGVVIFVLGVATKKGAPIKQKNGEFIKYDGKIIVSKLNENISELATQTGGVYIQGGSSSSDIKAMLKEITSISEEKELKSQEIQKYIPLFYYPVGMALFLLLIATSSIGKRQTAQVPSMFILFALLFVSPESKAGLLDFMELKEAKKAYELGEYEKSSKLYQNFANKSSNGEAHFNAGNSLYKQKKYKEALESYKKATFDTPDLRAKNKANMGNTYANLKQPDGKNLQDAVKSYEESLKIKEDKQTRENLEMVKKLIEKQKKEQEKQDKNQENKDKKDKQEKGDKKEDSKDGEKKDSNEESDKDSNEKKDSKKENDSSKSKDSKDKEKSKDDMKSKEEKEQEKKNKADKEKEPKKEQLEKLNKEEEKNKDKQKSEQGAAGEPKQDKMSEAEEQKWLKQLNMDKNTYMYKLNKKQNDYQNGDEKPW